MKITKAKHLISTSRVEKFLANNPLSILATTMEVGREVVPMGHTSQA